MSVSDATRGAGTDVTRGDTDSVTVWETLGDAVRSSDVLGATVALTDATMVVEESCVPSMDPKGDAVGAEEAIDDSDELGAGETEREEKREGDNDTAGVYE